MKYVSIAPSNKNFAWQVDLAFHSHILLNKSPEDFIVLSPYINHPTEKYQKYFPGYINEISVKPFWEYLSCAYDSSLTPLNIQTSLSQYNFDNDEIYIICDADVFIFRNINLELGNFDILHEPIYENWHMFQKTQYAHLKSFINGEEIKYSGFVPIILKGKTIKLILNDWINLHLELFYKGNINKWWCGMYSYNLACVLNHLSIKEDRICVLPFENKTLDSMFCLHYSVPFPNFDKHKQSIYLKKDKIFDIDFENLNECEKIMFKALIHWFNESKLANNYI